MTSFDVLYFFLPLLISLKVILALTDSTSFDIQDNEIDHQVSSQSTTQFSAIEIESSLHRDSSAKFIAPLKIINTYEVSSSFLPTSISFFNSVSDSLTLDSTHSFHNESIFSTNSSFREGRKAEPQDVSNILQGLWNVVGEGLHIASNYVKEDSNKKGPLRRPSRINNRGPPKLTEIPFASIPNAVLKSPRPYGLQPLQIQQRPFVTKIPGSHLIHESLGPTGYPLPERLVPETESSENSGKLEHNFTLESAGTSDYTNTEFSITPPLPPLITISSSAPVSLKTAIIKTRPPNGASVRFEESTKDSSSSKLEPTVFDVTVKAAQNIGNVGFNIKATEHKLITEGAPGDEFVMIDGKKTYFDLRPTESSTHLTIGAHHVIPTALGNEETHNYGYAIPLEASELESNFNTPPKILRPHVKGPTNRPNAPPIRIDTCIVGDDSTCEKEKYEVCKTYLGVSSCYCKPGYGRKLHRTTCKRIIQLLMSMQVDRMQNNRLTWSPSYENPNSHEYILLEGESSYALDTAMALTSLSNVYVGNNINRFFPLNGKVTVNATIELLETSHTRSTVLKRDIQRMLIQVIQARNSNIGNGNLYVEGPLNPIPGVVDYNECSEPESNDCHSDAICINQFGTFTCQCKSGYGDVHAQIPSRSGRLCTSCSDDYCFGRGSCKIVSNAQICECHGNYYGAQCGMDGDVLTVAISASISAVLIIALTLLILCLWSRKWKKKQQKSEIMQNYTGYQSTLLQPPINYSKNLCIPLGNGAPYNESFSEEQIRWMQMRGTLNANTYRQMTIGHQNPSQFHRDEVYAEPNYSYPSPMMSSLGPPPLPPPRPEMQTLGRRSHHPTFLDVRRLRHTFSNSRRKIKSPQYQLSDNPGFEEDSSSNSSVATTQIVFRQDFSEDEESQSGTRHNKSSHRIPDEREIRESSHFKSKFKLRRKSAIRDSD